MKCAVFTFIEDDDPLLPVWERYYPQYFDTVDRVQYKGEFDPEIAIGMVKNKFLELLQSHDVVMFSDIDEIVIPNPHKYNGLRDYIENMLEEGKEFAQAFGFDVIHNGEPPLDLGRPILPQRNHMSANKMYSKPLITTKMLQWSLGLHYLSSGHIDSLTDRDLVLFHLLLADKDIAWQRLNKRRQLTREELQGKLSVQTQPIPEHYKIA